MCGRRFQASVLAQTSPEMHSINRQVPPNGLQSPGNHQMSPATRLPGGNGRVGEVSNCVIRYVFALYSLGMTVFLGFVGFPRTGARSLPDPATKTRMFDIPSTRPKKKRSSGERDPAKTVQCSVFPGNPREFMDKCILARSKAHIFCKLARIPVL